jgi:hypothetical protein
LNKNLTEAVKYREAEEKKLTALKDEVEELELELKEQLNDPEVRERLESMEKLKLATRHE